jgi:HK97 family phage prohead protease
MTDHMVSVDEFMSRRKSSSRDSVLFKSTSAPVSWNGEKRSARFVMTTQGKDRDGDIVFTSGIDTTNFVKNPVCLLNHRSNDLIGAWPSLYKMAEQMDGDVVLAPPGTTPEVDKAAGLIGAGLLRAASIGFIPKTLKRIVLEDGTPTWSFEIVECELVECSIVTIPANPMALAKGMTGEPLSLARDLIEEVLDTYVKDPATGLIVPKAEYEAAHKEATGNKTSVVLSVDTAPALAAIKSVQDEAERVESLFTRIGKSLGLIKPAPPEPELPKPADPEAKKAALEAVDAVIKRAAISAAP